MHFDLGPSDPLGVHLLPCGHKSIDVAFFPRRIIFDMLTVADTALSCSCNYLLFLNIWRSSASQFFPLGIYTGTALILGRIKYPYSQESLHDPDAWEL